MYCASLLSYFKLCVFVLLKCWFLFSLPQNNTKRGFHKTAGMHLYNINPNRFSMNFKHTDEVAT